MAPAARLYEQATPSNHTALLCPRSEHVAGDAVEDVGRFA
jgi:hypothetical protein